VNAAGLGNFSKMANFVYIRITAPARASYVRSSTMRTDLQKIICLYFIYAFYSILINVYYKNIFCFKIDLKKNKNPDRNPGCLWILKS
jgi:hypothetical protein